VSVVPLNLKTDVCEWRYDEDDGESWDASCGFKWCLIEGTPKENRMKFCPGCGRPLKVKKGDPW
jgi:hypothetical protein